MTYYKGLIINTNYLKEYTYIYLDSIGYSYNPYQVEEIRLFESIFKNINKASIDNLKKIILNSIKHDDNNVEIMDKEIIQRFNKICNISNQKAIQEINNISHLLGTVYSIVYELVKDNEGNLFGREIYTKELFPILNSKCESFDYFIKIEGKNDYNFNLEIKPKVVVSSLLKCDNIIVGHKVADLNDFNKYINQFRGKRIFKYHEENDIERYKQKIIKIANGNVFKEDFDLEENLPKKEIVREKQSLETSLMEDIEFNLMKLKDVNKELYLEYKNKYEIILKEDVNREKLALLLGEIEYSIIFKKRNVESILDFINNLKEEYLNNFINNTGNKTDTDLKKLDKISELFLRIKDKFNLLDQRKVLRNIAFLYLMEVYENKDIISIEELENSYFSSNLKSIIIWINNLIEEDIIECDYLVSLRDDLNVEIVFDCIKNIRFKNKKFKK